MENGSYPPCFVIVFVSVLAGLYAPPVIYAKKSVGLCATFRSTGPSPLLSFEFYFAAAKLGYSADGCFFTLGGYSFMVSIVSAKMRKIKYASGCAA